MVTGDVRPLRRSSAEARIETACIAPDLGLALGDAIGPRPLDRLAAALAFPTIREARRSNMLRWLTWYRADGTCPGGSGAV